MAAVIVVLVFILIVKVTWKRANTGARIGAILACLITLWLFVAMKNPAAAGDVASGVASGTSAAVTGLGHFLTDVFG